MITCIHCCSLRRCCPNILYIDLLSFCVCYFTTIIFGAPAAQSPKNAHVSFVRLSKNSRNAQSILMKFDIGQSSDVCWHIPNVIKIRQNNGHFCMETHNFVDFAQFLSKRKNHSRVLQYVQYTVSFGLRFFAMIKHKLMSILVLLCRTQLLFHPIIFGSKECSFKYTGSFWSVYLCIVTLFQPWTVSKIEWFNNWHSSLMLEW